MPVKTLDIALTGVLKPLQRSRVITPRSHITLELLNNLLPFRTLHYFRSRIPHCHFCLPFLQPDCCSPPTRV
eukprot:Gb_29646 [translate_table: standard]